MQRHSPHPFTSLQTRPLLTVQPPLLTRRVPSAMLLGSKLQHPPLCKYKKLRRLNKMQRGCHRSMEQRRCGFARTCMQFSTATAITIAAISMQ